MNLKDLEFFELLDLNDDVAAEIDRRVEGWSWQRLADYGLRIKAVIAYRKEHPETSVYEARNKVIDYVTVD